jgi:cytochrome b involved in lipid metabolism
MSRTDNGAQRDLISAVAARKFPCINPEPDSEKSPSFSDMTGGEVRSYSWEDIRKHDKENDAWVVMDGEVFDVSKFLNEHPGGSSVVLPSLGTDIQEVTNFRPASQTAF